MAKRHLTERARKFLREVGSIVLGVLIALAIGEIADAVRWKIRVSNSVTAIKRELSANRFNLVERLAYQTCIEHRLSMIGRVLQDAHRTGVLPEIRNVGELGTRLTEQSAYEVARSEGTPNHMNSEKAREIAVLYGIIDAYVSASEEEGDYWKTLATLDSFSGPVGEDLLGSLLLAWSGAKKQAQFVGLVARQGDAALSRSGIAVEYDSDIPDHNALLARARSRSLCRPMLVARQRYGPLARKP